jgi:Flp pilus assembly protein TadD
MSLSGKWFGFGRDPDFDAALHFFESGQFEEAIELFRKVAEGPRDAEFRGQARSFLVTCLASHARQLARSGDAIRSRELFAEATELEPKYADLWLGLALAAGRLGDEATERGAVAKAKELNPTYGRAILYEALIALKSGDADKASEILAGTPGEPLAAGPPDLLIDAIQATLESEGDEANRFAAQADEAARDKQWDIAANLYRQAAHLKPSYADIRCKLAQTLLELDSLEEAEAQLRQAIDINPTYAEAWAQLGITLKRQLRRAEARVAFQKAYDLNPHHPIARLEISRPF